MPEPTPPGRNPESAAPPPADAVRAYVDAHAGDLQRWLADLVRARTVNPPGDEHLAARVLTDFCEARGIPYETFEKAPGRTNVVARIGTGAGTGAGMGGPRVIVPCHFDVVPAGDGWETDPFDPVVRGDRMIGRGTKDDKGPLAAMMLAADFLKAREVDLAGQLVLVGCADEEAGSELGMKYLLDECGLTGDVAVVPDAGHAMTLIDVGEKGALFFKVRAVGRQAHGSVPERGASALWPIVDFLSRIRAWRPPGGATDLFTPPTLNIGAVHGGSVPNIVPGKCEASIDVRYLPGTDGEALLEHLRGVVREVEAASPGVRMELEVLSLQPPTLVQADHPVIALLERHTEAVTGRRPKRMGQSGATVAKFLIVAGIPAVGFSCGPEGVEHMAGEWTGLWELGRFAEVMIRVVLDLTAPAA
jgi:acetylornithine deacetylase/succinyl-diaminopimelate desuccinylase-like protein